MKKTNEEIFNRYFKAESSREVEFNALPNMDSKIEALESAGYEINEGEKYEVEITLNKKEDEDLFTFANRVAMTTRDFSNGSKVMEGKLERFKFIAKKEGKDLGKADKLNVLSRLAKDKIKDGKFIVENWGGENFTQWCNWLRGLTEEEFNNLQK